LKLLLQAVLERIKGAGVTLNSDKRQFSQSRIIFLGHVVDKDGISPDPRKTAAISAMQAPSSEDSWEWLIKCPNFHQKSLKSPNHSVTC